MFKGLVVATSFLISSQAFGATFEIHVKGVKASRGNILLSVFNDKEAFPKETDKAVFKVKTPAITNVTVIEFENVTPGEYAVAVVHDENANDKMDKNSFGLPEEDFGFSNDVMGTFGPPSFKKAKVAVGEPTTQITINLKSF